MSGACRQRVLAISSSMEQPGMETVAGSAKQAGLRSLVSADAALTEETVPGPTTVPRLRGQSRGAGREPPLLSPPHCGWQETFVRLVGGVTQF